MAVRTIRRERDADTRRDAEERLVYAERVSAWTGPPVDDCAQVAALRARGQSVPYHFHTVVVRNGGTQPVYDLVTVVPAITDQLRGALNLAVGIVPPGDTIEKDAGCPLFDRLYAEPLEIYFTDVRSCRWRRDAEGRLRRADTPQSHESPADVGPAPDDAQLSA